MQDLLIKPVNFFQDGSQNQTAVPGLDVIKSPTCSNTQTFSCNFFGQLSVTQITLNKYEKFNNDCCLGVSRLIYLTVTECCENPEKT